MKYLGLLFLVFIFHFPAKSQPVKVMSFNIRLDLESDAENKWELRKASMVELLNHYEPGILGVQEAQDHQLKYLVNQLKNHVYIGVGRDDGKTIGEYSALLYDSTLFNVRHDTTIWLSENGEIGKLGWDAAYPRVCTYGLFENRSTYQKIWVFNTHFDHMGNVARSESAKLILNIIQKVNPENYPVILTGDFNLTSDTQPIQLLKSVLTDAFDASVQPHYGPAGTFSGFDPTRILTDRIDFVFTKNMGVQSIIHIDDRRDDNFFISDHLPVFCTLFIYQ